MIFEKLNGQRSGFVLVCEDFIYNFDKKQDDTERWRCKNRTCRSIIKILNDKIIENTPHNHDSDAISIKRLKMRNALKKHAVCTKDCYTSIITNETRNLESESLELLCKKDSMRRVVIRERMKRFVNNNITINDVPESLTVDLQGNKFLVYDSGKNDENRFLIFSSMFKKEYIEKSCTCIIDGTFRSAPGMFYQLLTIHIYIFNRSFPAFYILMKNKKQRVYDLVFSKINEYVVNRPKNIITDFEIGLSNSVSNIFANAKQFFCLFHYAQAIYKKIQAFGFVNLYKNNQIFRETIKMLFNLPFFHVKRIKDAYNKIKLKLYKINGINVDEFVCYYERTYLNMNDNLKSLYNYENWNVFDRVLKNIPRTTNNLESWHRVLNQKCVVAHPNISVFIESLREEEESNRIILSQILRSEFELSRRNLEKEEKIRIILINHEFFSDENLFKRLNSIFSWNF